MRIRRLFRLFYQLITDREIYFLTGLAIKSLFDKSPTGPRSAPVAKKRAKAMNAK